jgi:glycosyltransferase involved in cell wall biosynthesis
MPTLTVAMPAYNAGPYIKQAIESVLTQEGVDLELIVIDDASTDDTAAVVEAIHDPRITLLRNRRRQGIGRCHNVILRASRAPFLAHVDADDFLLPDALRKLVAALDDHPEAAQSHCYFFDVDEHGRTTLPAFIARWRHFLRTRPVGLDYQARLPSSNVANHLRTYRRAIVDEIGGFNETLRFGVDLDMALRIVDRHTIRLVPEVLYVRRVHRTNTTESLRFKRFRFWAQSYRIRRGLVREGKVRFLAGPQFDLLSFLRRLLTERREALRHEATAAVRRVWLRLRWRVLAPVSAWVYRRAVESFAWWPLGLSRPPVRSSPSARPRVVYYTSVFPVLSETFIQREVAMLRQCGVDIETVARVASDVENLDDEGRRLMDRTSYLDPLDLDRLAAYRRRFLRRRPLRLLNIFLYLVVRRYCERKSFSGDLKVFHRAVYLAGMLEDGGATRVHSPWGTTDALVTMLAAGLARISYSVQARASDLYKSASAYDLGERLAHAEFIVTNARYNVTKIRGELRPGARQRIVTIYEGIDIARFVPPDRSRERSSVFRILCVARLTEPKGLEYLIAAVQILKEAGHAIRCEVVGGRLPQEINYYLKLQRLRRDLDVETEVTWTGAVPFDRVLEKYHDADLFVLPAVMASDGRRDVTPNSIIEAMAMKLPVVSTTSGAIPELIEHGVSGLLVPPGDADSLAAAMLRVLGDPWLGATLGANARRKVEEQFDLHRNIRGYVELFDGGFVPESAATRGRCEELELESRSPTAEPSR